MLIGIMVFSFLTIFILGYLTLHTFIPVRGPVDMRLRALDNLVGSRSDIDHELNKSFRERILAPVTGSLASFILRFTPAVLKKLVVERLTAAGGFGNMGVEGFVLLCAIMVVAFPAMVLLITSAGKVAAGKTFAFTLAAAVIGLLIPFAMLNRKIAERKANIQRDLPDVLDLLTVSIEAGLSFDGALSKLAEKMKGALVDEFIRVLQEIRMGISRREALLAMGARCDVDDVSLFTTSLVQADQLGISIGNVLRIQSVSMREKRRQRAEEKAMKAPIKMMLPLVLFIFPTIFIVLLGPAIIRISQQFMGR